MRRLFLILAAALALAPAGCPAVCEQLETRCVGDVPQLCDPRGRWVDVMDECQESFSCQAYGEGHTCLPSN